MKFIISILFLLAVIPASAQWTSHLSIRSCSMSVMTDEGPVAGNNVGFFLKSNDGSLVEFTKVNHLSDINISALDADGSKVYVGYANGNIDIVDVSEFTKVNIPEFKNYTLVDDKTVNSISHHGNFIYCSTNSGLLVVNIQKQEIVSRYIVDKNAVPKVNASVVMGDSIYVATSAGLYRASLSSRILENSNEWTLCDALTTNYCDVTSIGGLVVAAKGSKGGTNEILVYRNGKREHFMTVQNFRNLSTDLSTLLVTSYGNITLISQGNIVDGNYDAVDSRSTCHLNESRITFTSYYASIFHGEIVIADASRGLMVVHASTNTASTTAPNGPGNNNCFHLLTTDDAVLCSGGGLDVYYNNLGRAIQVHCYANGSWSTLTNGYRDALSFARDEKGDIYLSAWGTGIYKIERSSEGAPFKFTEHYTSANSTLKDIFGGSSYTRTNALAFNSNSSLFTIHSEINYGMVVRNKEGEWGTISYPPIDNVHSTDKMIFTSNGNGWVLIPRNSTKGLFVFNTSGTDMDDVDDVYRGAVYTSSDERDYGIIKMWDASHEVITDNIYDIVEDKNGVLWFATDVGIVIFKGDKDVFDTQYPIFEKIKVPRNDGTNFADYLLDGVDVNAIAVDGANRKWIGTQKDGVYLVSDDGLETIYHFTTDNSPLVSNEVFDVAVSPTTGDVFFSTLRGIVSFHTDVIEPEESMSQISVYPNPVRPEYNGSVTLNGFTDGAYVKITDINGRLLYSTRSAGGRVVWNCRNLDGKKASTGVYIVWAVGEDAKEKSVARIAIIK